MLTNKLYRPPHPTPLRHPRETCPVPRYEDGNLKAGPGGRVSPARGGNVRRTKGDRATSDANNTRRHEGGNPRAGLSAGFPPFTGEMSEGQRGPPVEGGRRQYPSTRGREPKGWAGCRVSPARGGNVRRTKGDRATSDADNTRRHEGGNPRAGLGAGFPPFTGEMSEGQRGPPAEGGPPLGRTIAKLHRRRHLRWSGRPLSKRKGTRASPKKNDNSSQGYAGWDAGHDGLPQRTPTTTHLTPPKSPTKNSPTMVSPPLPTGDLSARGGNVRGLARTPIRGTKGDHGTIDANNTRPYGLLWPSEGEGHRTEKQPLVVGPEGIEPSTDQL